MDEIEHIDPIGDSSFAIMLEAQRRKFRVSYYNPSSLSLKNNILSANIAQIKLFDKKKGEHFQLDDFERKELSEFDVIHLRQDPPFNMNYITTTHLLDKISANTLIVNPPSSVRNSPEKILVTDFPELMPPTLITRDREEIYYFRKQYGDIIIKPLYGNGGAGVFLLSAGDQNLTALIELFEQNFAEPFMVQKYLPQVRSGDKRIILVGGRAVAALNRIPAPSEVRSNMHVGGKPVLSKLTKREMEICDIIAPTLKERGMIFVGIDVIGDYLTEINVTSPTGIREIKRFGGPDIAKLIWDEIELTLQRGRNNHG